MWKIRPSGSPVRAAERTLRGPCGASTGGVSSYWINSKTTTMYQHSTLCFRKHSRHRFLVTAPSIHENNFVLTSVWGGGRRGGEARNRRRTEPGAAFYLLSWSRCAQFRDQRWSCCRRRCPSCSDTLLFLTQPLRAQPHRQKCAQTGRKQRPPPSTWLWRSGRIPFQRKVCGVVAQQSQGSSGLRAPSQVILGDWTLSAQLWPPQPFKAFFRVSFCFSVM